MPIEQYYSPPAGLLGDAAFQVGLGEYVRAQEEQALRQAQLAEQQRQFDASFSLRERGLDADINSDASRRELANQELQLRGNLAANQERTRRYAMQQQAAMASADDSARLAAADLQGQYGLADQQLRNQAMLEAEALQQAAMGQRQQVQLQGQRGGQFQEQAFRQAQTDWANIQKIMPRLDPAERDDLIAQFQQRYQFAGVPMPVEIPQQELPEWMDPQVKLDRAREQYPDVPWQVDPETTDVGAPRGWNYQMSPQWQAYEQRRVEREHQLKLDENTINNEQTQQFEAAQGEIKLQQEADKGEVQRRHQEQQTRIREQDQLLDARSNAYKTIVGLYQQKAQLAAEAAMPAAEGVPRVDNSEAMRMIDEGIAALKRELSQFESGAPQAGGSGPLQWYIDIPSGSPYTAPDGTQRVKP